MNKKKKNMITACLIILMLLVSAGVILIFKGVPDKLMVKKREADEKKTIEEFEKQSSVLGEWVSPDDENFIIDVWRDGDGMYHAMINKSDEVNTVIFWELEGTWQDFDNGIRYNGCKKTVVKYDEEGNAKEDVIYEDGNGVISGNEEDGLYWDDKKENMGKNILFIYSGEY